MVYQDLIEGLSSNLGAIEPGSKLYSDLVNAAGLYLEAVINRKRVRDDDPRQTQLKENVDGRYQGLREQVDRINTMLSQHRLTTLPTDRKELGDFVDELIGILFDGRKR